MTLSPLIDCLQYANWSEKIFRQMREGNVHAVHVTIAYHENFRQTVQNIQAWNDHFRNHANLIFHGRTAADINHAIATNRTAIFFGTQTAAPIEEDIGLVEVCHTLGIRFMQLTYNNQSLLGTGFCEEHDSGITRFGREVIAEMNRVGIVVDMSHSAERTTLEAIDLSTRPIAITHANPTWWEAGKRNKSNEVIEALVAKGGMLGFSIYPNHLKDGSDCSLDGFCEMIAECSSRYGVEHLGIGSDLCQDQPDSIVQWMREGTWKKSKKDETAKFPPQPTWFVDNRNFITIAEGLHKNGFSTTDIQAIMGGNWHRFYEHSFTASL